MSWSLRIALASVAVLTTCAQASSQNSPPQSYAGLQTREIKAFSDEEISDLKAGRGMGLALPAELNGYPGPRHVLDLAEQLQLSGQQREAVRRLFDSMKAEALPIGQKLLAAERDLNRQFAEHAITPESLKTATAAIAVIRGELRNTHLKYHLSTAALLSPEQIARYADLRGYTGAAAMHPAGHNPAQHGMGGMMPHHTMNPMHGGQPQQ